MSPDDHPVLFRRAGSAIDRRVLREFAAVLREAVTAGRPFACLVTDDSELRRLNRRFLGHDYPTDVLSFPSGGHRELGEIAISIDRAIEQAKEFGHTLDDEIRILMLHGVLHLLGMDHETDAGSMARIEKRWRKKLGLPQSLIERAVIERAVIERTP
jgi:probable rRNA maturation factor